jgi:hypothetical protein
MHANITLFLTIINIIKCIFFLSLKWPDVQKLQLQQQQQYSSVQPPEVDIVNRGEQQQARVLEPWRSLRLCVTGWQHSSSIRQEHLYHHAPWLQPLITIPNVSVLISTNQSCFLAIFKLMIQQEFAWISWLIFTCRFEITFDQIWN